MHGRAGLAGRSRIVPAMKTSWQGIGSTGWNVNRKIDVQATTSSRKTRPMWNRPVNHRGGDTRDQHQTCRHTPPCSQVIRQEGRLRQPFPHPPLLRAGPCPRPTSGHADRQVRRFPARIPENNPIHPAATVARHVCRQTPRDARRRSGMFRTNAPASTSTRHNTARVRPQPSDPNR